MHVLNHSAGSARAWEVAFVYYLGKIQNEQRNCLKTPSTSANFSMICYTSPMGLDWFGNHPDDLRKCHVGKFLKGWSTFLKEWDTLHLLISCNRVAQQHASIIVIK